MSTTTASTDTDSRVTAAEVADFVEARYRVGRSTDGLLIATPLDPKVPRIARELRSLRPEIARAYRRERGIIPSRETTTGALDSLIADAEDAPASRVALRSARVGTAIHLDLGDASGRFVEISPYGWEIRDPLAENDPNAARALFRRGSATRAIPAPVRGGSRDDLRALLGLEAQDPRWMLLWGWLAASLFEDVPRPILWCLGPQGSGKSTRARMVLNVVDPADALGREPGKNERDDTTAAAARYLPSWDNIGSVSGATSDWLCRLVTGVEVGRRVLFTDDDLRAVTLRRSGVATSIVLPFGLGPDALERLVLVELERVPESGRRAESALWSEFERLQPAILGALLDDVSGILRHLDEVTAEPRSLPRMADYALLLHALDVALDVDDLEGYADAYVHSVRGVLAERATADPLTSALLKHAERNGGEWAGTSEALLRAIDGARPDDVRAPWPTSPSSLSAALMRGHETLRAAGLSAERIKSNGVRKIALRRLQDNGV